MNFAFRMMILLFTLNAVALPLTAKAVVYGNDDRLERYDIAHTRLLELARAGVALVDKDRIVAASPTWIKLSGTTHLEDQNLCPEERFASQTVVSGCSGSLIAPNVILTAGHCTANDPEDPHYDFCSRTYFVFDHALHQPGQFSLVHPIENVYRCRSVLRSEDREDGLDFALIELDRPVVGRKPVKLRETGELGFGEEIVAIGHPAGLPQKISPRAYIRSQGPIFFTANLDVSENSSGSPVFNMQTGLLEGIEASGEEDYDLDPIRQCNRIRVCPDNGCMGENVTKASVIRASLRNIHAPKWRSLLRQAEGSY